MATYISWIFKMHFCNLQPKAFNIRKKKKNLILANPTHYLYDMALMRFLANIALKCWIQLRRQLKMLFAFLPTHFVSQIRFILSILKMIKTLWGLCSYFRMKYHSRQSTHFKGWGLEILKNCKRVGVHIFPLKRVDWYKGWKQTIKGGVLQTSKLCTYIYKTKLKK